MTAERDQSVFAKMMDAWSEVRIDVASSLRKWDRQLLEMKVIEDRLRTGGRWRHGRDDFLGVLSKQRDELAHSRMIGWLLDPCGRHGLGTQFLAAIVERALGEHWNPAELARAKVELEVPVLSGRMDIVVSTERLYLVVENKVDAEEAVDQCKYYVDNVSDVRDKRFILLSPDGRGAQTTDTFRPISYKQVCRILESALEQVPVADSASDELGRGIAAEYLRTLKMEFA